VVLVLVDENGDTHRIAADRIAYDRATSSVTARGSVKYERKSGSATEIFEGEALSANLDDWSGLFLDGRLRRSIASSKTSSSSSMTSSATSSLGAGERGVVISADVLRKKSSEVMVLENGVVSGCDAADPHYSIKAGRRIWLLGDREWAVSNAVFSLGNVPVLWLPFFYYPGDELVFHPVIGYRTREGRFVQTTTYLLGKKPKKEEKTTLLALTDSGPDKPTKLEGLFLRRVAGPAPKDEGTIKLMADAYSALGVFGAVQGDLPKLFFLGKTTFFGGLGLSRSLFSVTDGYSPYVAAGDWESVWNRSSLFGADFPLRYGLEFSTGFSAGGLSLSFAAPLYSDPYFDRDFRNRSEDMDWFKLFSTEEAESTSVSLRTQLQPKFDASFSFNPKALNPWLQSVSLTRFSSSMTFSSKDKPVPVNPVDAALQAVDPSRKFYYPYSLVPFDIAVSLRGSFIPPPSDNPASRTGRPQGGEGDTGPSLRSPWLDTDEKEGANGSPRSADTTRTTGSEAEAARLEELGAYRVPKPFGSVPRTPNTWSWTANWSLSPTLRWEDRYRSSAIIYPEDIDFSRQYSLFEYGIAAALDGSLSYGGGMFGGTMGLSFSKRGQERPYLYNDADAASYLLADYRAASDNLTGAISLSTKPFTQSWLWASTSLSWNMNTVLYKRIFKEMSGSEPVYDETLLAWEKTSITSHNVSMLISARPGGLSQSLTLTAALPPVDESYKSALSLNVGFASLTADGGVYRSLSSGNFSFYPLTTSLRLGSSPGIVVTNAFIYNLEDGIPVSDSLSASWGPLSSTLTAKQEESYTPVAGMGWQGNGDKSFRPTEFTMSIRPSFASPEGGGALRWSFSPSCSLTQNLLQFSKSTLSFDFTASIKISTSFSLSATMQSRNASAWRYFPELFKDELEAAGFSPEDFYVNPLEDFWNSISIWDSSALKRGLIKLKALKFEAIQDLHDWTLTVGVEAKPKLADDGRSYFIDTSFSLLLAWKDFSDIKANIKGGTSKDLSY
jgi:hypothetical protein